MQYVESKIYQIMKRLKVRDVLKMLEEDGWCHITTKGSHRQFKHPQKKGRVTVNGKLSETMDQNLEGVS